MSGRRLGIGTSFEDFLCDSNLSTYTGSGGFVVPVARVYTAGIELRNSEGTTGGQ